MNKSFNFGTYFVAVVLVFHWTAALPLSAQSWQSATGLRALQSEVGPGLEVGAGVNVAMIEAPTGAAGAYRPDFADSEFANINFFDQTGTNTAVSGHATTVARSFYGSTASASPGVASVTLYEADDWLNNVTGLDGNANPASQPFGVQNHSYIGNNSPAGAVLSLLRRSDYMASQNDMVVVVGTNNQGVTPQLMAPGFNLLSVGLTDGTHAVGATQFYRSGRSKPEIVSPRGATSFSTPTVSSTAAMLREAAFGTNGDHAEIIRAMILAGATKTEFESWTQRSDRPIDARYGVGELNVYNSYQIFQAGETDGESQLPKESAGSEGWDFGTIEPFESLNYVFELDSSADHVSIALTWDITIIDTNQAADVFVPSDRLANLDLTVVGPNGVMESISTNHNIEHIYLRDAPAGQYFIIVEGDSSASETVDFGLAWRSAIDNAASLQSMNVVQGVQAGGGLKALDASDDNYSILRPSAGQNEVVVEFTSASPVNWINAMSLDLEARSSTVNLNRTIEFFDYDSGQFEVVDRLGVMLGDNRSGIAVTDNASGLGYFMYTEEPVYSRFPTAISSAATNIIAVRFIGGFWQYNDNNEWLTFEPVDSDHILALVDFSNDTITSFEDSSFSLGGIDGGYIEGDLEFFANQFSGEPNDGEFDLVGTFFIPEITDTESTADKESVGYLYGETDSFTSSNTGEIRARVSWEPIGPVLMYPWTLRIDKAEFTVSK